MHLHGRTNGCTVIPMDHGQPSLLRVSLAQALLIKLPVRDVPSSQQSSLRSSGVIPRRSRGLALTPVTQDVPVALPSAPVSGDRTQTLILAGQISSSNVHEAVTGSPQAATRPQGEVGKQRVRVAVLPVQQHESLRLQRSKLALQLLKRLRKLLVQHLQPQYLALSFPLQIRITQPIYLYSNHHY